MRLIFPESDTCIFVVDNGGKIPQTPSEFKRCFDFSLSFVPVLGPVEHDEQLFREEAARRALQTHRASRNFRNIWFHYPEKFFEFSELIKQTWPDTTIRKPELTHGESGARLHMFYEEKRFSREIFWSGFGFQAWCQMITFITKAGDGSFLVIDEPDVYLHSDIQRQLIQVLRDRKGDSLIATHSTEMLSEAESGEIIIIDRKVKRSRKISRPLDLAGVFTALGSGLNPILTQLSKTRRVLFVEGGDFDLLGAFARRLGKNSLANQSGFAIVPAYGFNPARVKDFSEGMEQSLGFEVKKAVIFDRDYRIFSEVEKIKDGVLKFCSLCYVHKRKEIENYLLVPDAISRCIHAKLKDRERRGATARKFDEDVAGILNIVIENMKPEIFGQFSSRVIDQLRESNKSYDSSTLHAQAHALFEERWKEFDSRLAMAPGKKVLAKLNEIIQRKYSVALSPKAIISSMQIGEVPEDIFDLMVSLEDFCR